MRIFKYSTAIRLDLVNYIWQLVRNVVLFIYEKEEMILTLRLY